MGRARVLGAVLAGILLAECPCAVALNPDLDVSQYAHKSWTVREGFFKSGIAGIAQTPDGYLWLGTQFGLLRFDGVKSVAWNPPPVSIFPATSFEASSLRATARFGSAPRKGSQAGR